MVKHLAVVFFQQLQGVRILAVSANEDLRLYLGSRIYYDRAFLLSRRDSPMTRSPPCLPFIPEGEEECFCWRCVVRCRLPLVTLIPEPEKQGNVVENGVKSDKKEGLNSSVQKSNSSASEQVATPTLAKKGRITPRLPRNSSSFPEGDDQFSMDM